MRCHICDRVLDEPKFNKDTDAYEPCEVCMAVILDTMGSFEDRPYLEEDELTHQWEAVLGPLTAPPDE